MLTVGEYYLAELEEREKRAASAFAGGVGHTLRDQCGAFSAGVMIIGALLGRTRADEDDLLSRQAVQEFRDRFIRTIGSVRCDELRADQYGSDHEIPCSDLVSDAIAQLAHVLEKDEYRKELK